MEQNQTSPGLLLMNNNEQTINKEQAHFTGIFLTCMISRLEVSETISTDCNWHRK